MVADYLISSLQPLDLDGPAPYTMERFLEMCRDQLGPDPFKAHAAAWALNGSGPSWSRHISRKRSIV